MITRAALALLALAALAACTAAPTTRVAEWSPRPGPFAQQMAYPPLSTYR